MAEYNLLPLPLELGKGGRGDEGLREDARNA
jgi:hypothetical protein